MQQNPSCKDHSWSRFTLIQIPNTLHYNELRLIFLFDSIQFKHRTVISHQYSYTLGYNTSVLLETERSLN